MSHHTRSWAPARDPVKWFDLCRGSRPYSGAKETRFQRISSSILQCSIAVQPFPQERHIPVHGKLPVAPVSRSVPCLLDEQRAGHQLTESTLGVVYVPRWMSEFQIVRESDSGSWRLPPSLHSIGITASHQTVSLSPGIRTNKAITCHRPPSPFPVCSGRLCSRCAVQAGLV